MTPLQRSSIPVLIAGTKQRHDGLIAVKPKYIHRVKESDFKDFFDLKRNKIFEGKYGFVRKKESEKLFFLMRLIPAIQRKDEVGINDAVESYVNAIHGLPADGEEAKQIYFSVSDWLFDIKLKPGNTINQVMNEWLKNVRVIVWWSKREKRASIGLYCEDIITALFVLWVRQLNEVKGMSICLRCSSPFERSRINQKYCSPFCQNADGVARFRRKK